MKQSPLHDLQKAADATWVRLFGWELPDSFGNTEAEYHAAHEGVAVMDRSYVGRFRVSGKDALDLLNRLSSNKLEELPPGAGKGSILPTNKGRVIDLLHLFAREDHLLMLTSPQTRERVAEWIDLYTFLEEMALEDVTESTAMLSVLGPRAGPLVQELSGVFVASLEPYASITAALNGIDVTLLRTDPLRSPGYDLIVPAQHAPEVWRTLLSSSTGAAPIGERVFDLLRIEAGVPRYGWEVSEGVNPWEANLQEYINFEKGCYIGQEVILRLNTYQKVQRNLIALTFSGGDGVASGDKLYLGDEEAGVVTSVAERPGSGERIGLGLIRRALATPETELRVAGRGGGTAATATLHELPARVPVAR